MALCYWDVGGTYRTRLCPENRRGEESGFRGWTPGGLPATCLGVRGHTRHLGRDWKTEAREKHSLGNASRNRPVENQARDCSLCLEKVSDSLSTLYKRRGERACVRVWAHTTQVCAGGCGVSAQL